MHIRTVFLGVIASIGIIGVAGIELPNVTGPLPVGTIALELVDYTRNDPLATGAQPRSLMVSIFYPTSQTSLQSGNYSLTPYLPPQTAAAFDSLYSLPTGTAASIVTQSYQNAPIANSSFPVVIFSPGFAGSRLVYSAQLEDLASQGWVVVGVDHTYEAVVVEFPDGTLVPSLSPDDINLYPGGEEGLLEVRVADVAFVASALKNETIAAQIPGLQSCGSAARLQLDQVGVFGHSFGGATAAQAMRNYSTFACGANFDGDMHGTVAQTGLDRPFLLMASQSSERANDTTWGIFWDHLTGFRREFTVNGTLHASYTDYIVLRDILGDAFPAAESGQFGTITGRRVLEVETAFIDAYFGYCLKDQPASRIDDLVGSQFPDVYVGL